MTITLALSVLVFALGIFLYVWARNPKVNEIGRLMFAVGLLVALLQLHGGLVASFFRQ